MTISRSSEWFNSFQPKVCVQNYGFDGCGQDFKSFFFHDVTIGTRVLKKMELSSLNVLDNYWVIDRKLQASLTLTFDKEDPKTICFFYTTYLLNIKSNPTFLKGGICVHLTLDMYWMLMSKFSIQKKKKDKILIQMTFNFLICYFLW